MNFLAELRRRFAAVLAELVDDPAVVAELVEMVRPSGDPRFGDYQANCAMPLQKRLGKPSREIARLLTDRLALDDLCRPPEIAGPGFINLSLRDDVLAEALSRASADEARLGIPPAGAAKTYVIDYSSPNVAKPMHVGHIRSTVIGDALYRLLGFLGHRVISDNHVGDWGTQFGMILFGFKHFRDEAAYRHKPVEELARLYRLVNRLVEYHEARRDYPEALAKVEALRAAIAQHEQMPVPKEPAPARQHRAALAGLHEDLQQARAAADALQAKIRAVDEDPPTAGLAEKYPDIGAAVLEETARLHEGDEENRRLWREFLPPCMETIDEVYRRLGVRFDYTLGESFYHDRLPAVVESLLHTGLARESHGAVAVFDDRWPAPMLVRKQDGAFLYATTDLATIAYRVQQWQPDAILYVVDHRQSLHFQQLFDTARRWGYADVELTHVSFGTILDEKGQPYRTRSGDTVGLLGLLDEAVRRALEVVRRKDAERGDAPGLSPREQLHVAEVVGVGCLKYADLSHNRTSDYVFSYDKMLSLSGNTAAYMQYMYARVESIFRRESIDAAALRGGAVGLSLETPQERGLALALARFGEALDAAAADYRPNQLTAYLWNLAGTYSKFYEECPVLKAPSAALRDSRLVLCDLTARTIRKGLELLGISVVERM